MVFGSHFSHTIHSLSQCSVNQTHFYPTTLTHLNQRRDFSRKLAHFFVMLYVAQLACYIPCILTFCTMLTGSWLLRTWLPICHELCAQLTFLDITLGKRSCPNSPNSLWGLRHCYIGCTSPVFLDRVMYLRTVLSHTQRCCEISAGVFWCTK